MGKPINQSYAEVDKCIWLVEETMEFASDALSPEAQYFDDISVIHQYASLGTILGIMPWNFPLWQTMRFAVPTLAAGNAIILKPAPNAYVSATITEEVFTEALGIENLFQVIPAEVDQVESVLAS